MKYEKMKQQKERKRKTSPAQTVDSSSSSPPVSAAFVTLSLWVFIELTEESLSCWFPSFTFFVGVYFTLITFFFFLKRSSFLTFSLNRFICSLMRRSEPQIVWWESGFKGLKTIKNQKHSDVNRWNLNVVTSGCRFIIFTHKLY